MLEYGILAVLLLMTAGCDIGPDSDNRTNPVASCNISTENFADGGVGKDGIPALTDPSFVAPEQADYLAASDRVIGFEVDGQACAVPHNILWHHEIANLNFDRLQLAITYCPLTGSSLAFDRAVIDGAEFGVSGLLLNNNLTMYDRTDQESLWPQMNRTANCGPRTGSEPDMHPVFEMTWDGWQTLHPNTRVVSRNTGFNRTYTAQGYPYGNYEQLSNDRLLFPAPIDERRPPKERLLGVPDGEGGAAYPFGALDDGSPVTVVQDTVGGMPLVVLWNRAREGAMAFQPVAAGQPVTLEDRNGHTDRERLDDRWTRCRRAAEGHALGAGGPGLRCLLVRVGDLSAADSSLGALLMRARWPAIVSLLALLLGVVPGASHAQWIEPPGTGWVQLRIAHHDTERRFGPQGNIVPLFNEESRSITTSVFLTGAVGLVRGFDAWAQVPFHRLQFNDVVRDRTSTGLGDPRLFLRAGPGLLGFDLAVPIAVRGGVKFSVGNFPIDAEVIPLTEGQRDWELLVELGHSHHPTPVYVMGWAGYRWREINEAINRKPGDERILYGAVGGSLGAFTWKLAVDALFGQPPRRRLASGIEIKLENDTRRLVQVIPTVGWRLGPGALEVGGRFPVDGRNLPAGPALTVGYFISWDRAPW